MASCDKTLEPSFSSSLFLPGRRSRSRWYVLQVYISNDAGTFSGARISCQGLSAWPATFKMMNSDQLNAVYDAFSEQG